MNGISYWSVVRTGLILSLWLMCAVMQAQDFIVRTNVDGTLTITRYVGRGGDLIIPETINGLLVTRIVDFGYCTNLTSVKIPASVTDMVGRPFSSCTSLTAITVDVLNTAYSSEDGVLFNQNKTTLLQYPAAKAGSYNIPATVCSIGSGAFSYCYDLTSCTFPASVTSIGDSAFFCCTNLLDVTIGHSVTNIGKFAFSQCSSLTAIAMDVFNAVYYSENGVLFNKDQSTLVQFPGGKTGSYSIPVAVKSIEAGAFYYCYGLTSVSVFASVTNIAGMAFGGCTSLTTIKVDVLNPVYSSEDGVLFNKNQTTLIQCPSGKIGSYTVPSSVTSIGGSAFYDCYSLTSVMIPGSVSSIEKHAFDSCLSLTGIIVDRLNPIYSDDEGVLLNKNQTTLIQCPSGKTGTYSVPNSVTNIGDDAFSYCTNLTSVIIPGSITMIGHFPFNFCTSVIGIYFLGDAPSFGGGLYGIDKPTLYYLPGTVGWGPTAGGLPTALWNPKVQTSHPDFGVSSNGFGFTIAGTANIPILIEASTNLSNPSWLPLQSLRLTNGSHNFSDAHYTNCPARFYRIRSP